jgi:GNAT superfamily N-acetyltransferase
VVPWVKDYDAVNPPQGWPDAVPGVRWHLVLAGDDGVVRGAAAAFVDGSASATLWDIRVQPSEQRGGVGRRLVEACRTWADSQGASWLKAETQNVNVPACRFYAALGAHLSGIDTTLYAGTPVEDEVALFWLLPTRSPG